MLQFLGLKREHTMSPLETAFKSNHEFLSAYASFLDWNSNKEIAEAAEHLYSHIDHLELYVGLQGEEAKTPVHGAGLCPGVFQRFSLFN